jgi:hypothetical protein
MGEVGGGRAALAAAVEAGHPHRDRAGRADSMLVPRPGRRHPMQRSGHLGARPRAAGRMVPLIAVDLASRHLRRSRHGHPPGRAAVRDRGRNDPKPRIVEMDILADPERLSQLDLTILD